MKKLLLIAILMLALVITAVACTGDKNPEDTTIGDTTVETPTEAPTSEPDDPTEAPTDKPEDPTETPTDKPEDPTEAPTEEPTEAPTADPADPVLILEPEDLNTLAGAGAPNVNQLAGSEVITEGSYTFARLTAAAGGDPYLAFIPLGSNYTLPQYMAIAYRTNSTTDGQIFLGSGAGWNGQGDVFNVAWNEGDWNYIVIDLSAQGLTSITDGLLSYARLDFFAGDSAEGDYFDVEYIAFFNTAEYAEAYYSAKHPAYVTPAEGGQTAVSFDTFKVNGEMYFPEDGGASDKLDAIDNTVIFDVDQVVETVTLRGWIGFSQAIEAFGYYIDNPYAQTFGEFKAATEDVIFGLAGEHATRFEINVPVADLERGEHTIGYLAKLADGTVVLLRTEITIVIPTNYPNYNVPQDLWTVTGHCPGIVGAEGHANSGMVVAGGVESGALIHQGAIALGEIDLSKYSKVVIMWGCDASDVTVGHYNQSANNRIMLTSADVNGTAPADGTIIAGGTYELKGWAVTAFEIDLTGIDYNGPVYVAIDTLPGTFALFSSVEFIGAEIVEFIGAEIVDDEPEAPAVENVVIDLSTIAGHKAENPYGYNCPIIEIGYDQVYLMGQFDLNQYSQIIIEYSYDGDTVTDRTPEQCWTDCSRAPIIGFTGLEKCFGFANVTNQDAIDLGIYTEMPHTPGNWAAATRTATIEIPEGIGYNGPCYLSAYNPWGRVIAVASVTLVPRA